MSAQPDDLFYHPHGEVDDRPRALVSLYTEDTVPNDPITDPDQAAHILLKHVQLFVENDTEDPHVRYCCLVADLGYRVDEEAFYHLCDVYHEPMTPNTADYYLGMMRDYLGGGKP